MRRFGLLVLGLSLLACGQDRPPPIVGPQPLRFAAGTFDRARGQLLVYTPGNDGAASPTPDSTWAFDGEGWRREDAFGPSAREAPGLVFDEARGHPVMFGGERVAAAQAVAETFVYEAPRWRRLELSGPGPRHSPAIAYDPGRQGTWMYGGFGTCTDEECQALWFFDGRAWRRVD